MATPSGDLSIDLEALKEYICKPKVDYTKPYQVGKREYHKSPGHRSWTEVWVHPNRRQFDSDDPWSKNIDFDHRVTHQGTDFIHYPEFWQEVEMLSGEDTTVDELRAKMNHLSREEVEAGFRHYYDKFTWEDGSERVRKLRDAFEAEHQVPSGARLFEKKLREDFISGIYAKVLKEFEFTNIIIDDDAGNLTGLIAA